MIRTPALGLAAAAVFALSPLDARADPPKKPKKTDKKSDDTEKKKPACKWGASGV